MNSESPFMSFILFNINNLSIFAFRHYHQAYLKTMISYSHLNGSRINKITKLTTSAALQNAQYLLL